MNKKNKSSGRKHKWQPSATETDSYVQNMIKKKQEKGKRRSGKRKNLDMSSLPQSATETDSCVQDMKRKRHKIDLTAGMERATIDRAAVGRIATLGELYDATKDEFLGINAFKEALKGEEICEEGMCSQNVEFIITDSVNEQFEKLDINAELSLSIMSGLVKLSGSASYLNSQKSSTRTENMALTYSVLSKHQKVNGTLKWDSKVNTDYLCNGQATHIVVGIDWGAKCNITCQCQKSTSEDEKQIKLKVQAELDKIKHCLLFNDNNSANAESSIEDDKSSSKFSYHISCDVNLKNNLPVTFKDAVDVAKSLPEAVVETKNGKGVPIAYKLLSLNYLSKICKLEIESEVIFKPLKEHVAQICIQTLQSIKQNRKQINDLVEDFKDHKDAVSLDEFNAANKLLSEFENKEANFNSDLRKALIEARSGHKNGPTIENVCKQYIKEYFSTENISSDIQKYEHTVEKLRFIDKLKDRQVLYIGRGGSIENEVFKYGTKKVYAFYLDYSKRNVKEEKWQKYRDKFFKLVSDNGTDKGVIIIFVDCELLPKMTLKKGMRIEFYKNGTLDCEDLLGKDSQGANKCIVELIVRDLLQIKPNRRVQLKIICPNSYDKGCRKGECQWICSHCNETVEYGLDNQSLYCRCGRSDALDSMFRCDDKKHGLCFIKFDPERMRQHLSYLRLRKETNIILLGEKGVGKSTWINAIANYFSFATLKDAIDADDLKFCIPFHYTYTSETGIVQNISVGSETGHSATQGPRAYIFSIDNETVRLIDTPGIGDVPGLEHDENFENILAHLKCYDDIHGICIFLKAKESRLTKRFRFYITEFLTRFHNSAAENIVFCFTNTKCSGTGGIVPMLSAQLNELKRADVGIFPSNHFCFDNEAFLNLACLKKGVDVKPDIITYSSSWDKAATEAKKLLEHIQRLKPHSVKCTLTLNDARQFILDISELLARTASLIQKNIMAADAKSNKLQARKVRAAKELEHQLFLDEEVLETVQLDQPRTVVTERIDYVEGPHSTRKVIYKKHEQYMYAWENRTARVLCEERQQQLEKQNCTTHLSNFIKKIKNHTKELESERTVIMDISAEVGYYLKTYAIAPFNDNIESQLQMLIKEENSKDSPNQSAIKNLEATRKMYQERRQTIYKAMEQNGSHEAGKIWCDHGEMIEKVKEELSKLKHNGASFKKLFEERKQARTGHWYEETEVPLAEELTPWRRLKAFGSKVMSYIF